MDNKQKTCEELIERFIGWGNSNQNIRLSFIIGSRARETNPADEWSDLDLVIVTNNTNEILNSDEWLSNFGSPKIMFLENTFGNGKERRILFDNGLDIDFVVFTGQQFKEIQNNSDFFAMINRGIRILFDKDNLTANLKIIDEEIHSPSMPNQEEFLNRIQDFWYHSVWTAKKLRRGEILQAKYACDTYMKDLLIELIRWHTHCKKGCNYDTWHNCRFFERWADQNVLIKMKNVYAYYEKEDIWRALLSTMKLFSEIAKESASYLKYQYPVEVGDFAMDYVNFLFQNR